MKKKLKQLRYIPEAFLVFLLYAIFYVLPIDIASAFGGWIARKIGILTSANNTAYKNLTLVFPDKTDSDKNQIIVQMWDNLGRMIGELPHWHRIDRDEFYKRVTVIRKFKNPPSSGALFISAHFGNFELASKISKEENLDLHLVYRPANNPYVNFLINYGRLKNNVKLFAKGMIGVKQIFSALQNGKIIGMLVDQKTNDGIDSSFMGHLAKTTSLPAKLAIKYKTPILIAQIKRTSGAHYKVILNDFKYAEDSDNPESLTQKINDELGDIITKEPQQWFWIHKRWKI